MPHDFLHELYDSLNDSPMQRKLRSLCPLPIGVVYVGGLDDDEAELRHHLRLMRECGFDSLKQFHFQSQRQWQKGEAELIAIEEGIIPYFSGGGGWENITPKLLGKLEIDADLPMEKLQNHPAMIEYQTEILWRRARRLKDKPAPPNGDDLGEPVRFPCRIPTLQRDDFIVWLQEKYGDLENCRIAYKLFSDKEQTLAWPEIAAPFVAEIKASETSPAPPSLGWMDFLRARDVMRFQADRHQNGIANFAARNLEWDADEPVRCGCHMVFENQALNGWDFELQASAIKDGGSFYASFHPAHHLNEVAGELALGAYATSRLVHDLFKGGWSAMWESIGGPSQYSGTFPFAAEPNSLAQCLLCYLAAGLKGAGIWSWNARDWGWETGEYALCDLTGKPTERARLAGQIAQAARRWRFELWQARDEPRVGIFYGWENDAAFARLGMGGYDLERLREYPTLPGLARLGAARAFLGGNVPFEFVTERDLQKGLAPRYPTILLTSTTCLSRQNLQILRKYVEAGGHLVLDAPTLSWNENGVLFDTRKGSDFEQIFGWEHAGFHSTFNHPLALNRIELDGQTFDLNVTGAQITQNFDGSSRPAILENRCGKGKATALAFEAARLCH